MPSPALTLEVLLIRRLFTKRHGLEESVCAPTLEPLAELTTDLLVARFLNGGFDRLGDSPAGVQSGKSGML